MHRKIRVMKERPAIDPASLVDPSVACCAGCAQLDRPDCETVVLLSGARVCTSCPAWLRETGMRQFEALNVLDLADRATRQRYLERREQEFGSEYRSRLSAVVLETWNRRQSAAQPKDVQ